jgi:glycerol-3-phosphate O-acyltransferase
VRATLDALVSGGVVTLVRDGREPVWLIGPEHQLAATFYRNSLIHFLLDTALCELAVLRAGEAGSGGGEVPEGSGDLGASGASGASGGSGASGASGGSGASAADPVAAFWEEIARLRDLLKFEFYFKDREEHRRQVGEEMARHDPAWEDKLRAGQADALLAGMRPLVSHVMVRPFVEAYRIVADVLVNDDVTASDEDSEVMSRALGLGQQYVAQRRLRSAESVSVLLFQTGLQLARNQGLFEPTAGLAARRAAFLAELRHLVRRLDQIEDLAIKRYIRDAVSVMPTD